MKKTLFTAALALASAASASAADTFTIASRDQTPAHNCLYTGFNMTLAGQEGEKGNWLTCDPDDALPAQVYLNNLTLSFGIRGDKHTEIPMGIAIFQKNEKGSWDYVAKSDWNTDIPERITVATDVTFTFSDVVLSSTTQYSYFFYGHEGAFSELTTGYTMPNYWDMLLDDDGDLPTQAPSEQFPLVRPDVGWSDERNYGSEGAYRYNDESGDFSTHEQYVSPVIEISVTEYIAPVDPAEGAPEPTTTTLSLLALAGLAARRRRKD